MRIRPLAALIIVRGHLTRRSGGLRWENSQIIDLGGVTVDELLVPAVIIMVIFFLGIPVLLGVLVYRAAQKSKKRGIYFLVGVLLISAIMPAYAIYLGTILGIVFQISLHKAANKKAPIKDK